LLNGLDEQDSESKQAQVRARHILPAFGDHRLTDIVPLHVEEFSRAKSASGLSSKSVRNLLLIVQAIFSIAVDNDLVIKSPVRKSHKPIYQRKEKPVWSPAQIQSIIEAAPPLYRAFLCCAALTGARLGELLGLQWKHIDLSKRTVRIEQSLWHGNLVPPKTVGSVRTICFGNTLALALTSVRDSKNHTADDFVFSSRDGRPLHPDVLRKDVLYPILDGLRIPRISGASGFHTFRHSVASILNQETGNLKLAQKLLGHATIDMTADVYTHTSGEAEREAALAIERAIYGDLFPIVPNSGSRNNSAVLN
jgi:integrase